MQKSLSRNPLSVNSDHCNSNGSSVCFGGSSQENKKRALAYGIAQHGIELGASKKNLDGALNNNMTSFNMASFD